jgi:hypothetical protein
MSGKPVHSLTGRHAVLRRGAEITALVDAPVCYDVDFLGRIRETELMDAREKEDAEEATRRGMANAGKAAPSLLVLAQPQLASGAEAAHQSGATRENVETPHASGGNLIVQDGLLPSSIHELIFSAPTSPANLAAAMRYSLAVNRVRKAAGQGDVEAEYTLGMMYHNGEDVQKNDIEAVIWLRKAADQGFAKAQESLQAMCRDGDVSASEETSDWAKQFNIRVKDGGCAELGVNVQRSVAESKQTPPAN